LVVTIFPLKVGVEIVKKLFRFNQKQKFILFDYETCGLNLCSQENKPWQLAFLVADQNKIFEKKDFYLKWDNINISEEAKKVTGFDQKKYESISVDPKKVLDELDQYFYNPNYFIVGHNIIGFDIYIHNIHRLLCKKVTDYSYMNRIIDTNCLAKAKSLDLKINSEDFLSWQIKLSHFRKRGLKTNLKFLCEHYNINFEEAKLHDALYDITKNYEVFNKLIWDFDF